MRACLVVPCFDEASRFDSANVAALVDDDRVEVLLVDDGSRDGTKELLSAAAERLPRVTVESLPQNRGKAAAVRHGLLAALDRGADVVGYADADFATPPGELLRLLEVLSRGEADVVLGSRVARLGARIERRTARHLVGRAFATLASAALGLPIYDTQCGAKWFRVTPALRAALSTPFETGWAFDVELLARLLGRGGPSPPARIVEVPLLAWTDVGGSKVTTAAGARAMLDVAWMAVGRRRR